MPEKTLRIIFNGISTLWPGPPRDDESPPDKAFVIMAANEPKKTSGKRGKQTRELRTNLERAKQKNDWGVTIPEHFPFVRVARSLLVDPPDPSETVILSEGGEHFIYFFRDARVVIHSTPKSETPPLVYFVDPKKRPLADRPGSDNVAPPDDIRWLADIRDILSEPAPLKKTANPTEAYLGEEVAAVVNLDGGKLTANFPCATIAPKTFKDAKSGKTVAGLRRVLADEFIIEIPYSEDTDGITLEFQQLRKGKPVNEATRLKELVLDWPKSEALLVVRMGNDTKDEVRRLDTPGRFDGMRRTGPLLKPHDDDFDLHYNFLKIPKDAGRPLPQNDIQQCDFNGCKPAVGGSANQGGSV
jgi:hypothetical protein